MAEETFGELCEKYRSKRGFSKAELARRLDVSRFAVAHWEDGTNKPEGPTLLKLVDLLELTKEEKIEFFKKSGRAELIKLAEAESQALLPAPVSQQSTDLPHVGISLRQPSSPPDFVERHKNIFQLFSEAPRPLASYIRVDDFRSLVLERTRNFVGRKFVFQAIDEMVNNPTFQSGYILIRGEPGIGKTALIAQLVKQRAYVHHFNIALQNIRSVQDFLANVCAQLIVRYELAHSVLPSEALKDSGFLVRLLTEAAAKHEEQPIVVLIDALDEAEDIWLATGANRLFLPETLPKGVFFILTTREEEKYHLKVDRRKDIFLRDNDPRNLEDVREYIQRFISENRDQMNTRLREWHVDNNEFISVLTEKSEGNFMYLVFMLDDIKSGNITVDTIDNIYSLPRGLDEYYAKHWELKKAQYKEKFTKAQQEVVCMLATVREPVYVNQIEEWLKLSRMEILEVIAEWRKFLNVFEQPQQEPRYRIYHMSFGEFLEKRVGLTSYHNKIATAALSKIPDWEND